MGKTRLSSERKKNLRNVNIGRVLIFCEGLTEKQYFEYFAGIIRKSRFDDIQVKVESANGNPDIQGVIGEASLSENEYELLVSNYLFEIWLLMHFENVSEKLSKPEIYERLGRHLVHEYEKGDAGVIREIMQKGSVEEAIANAEEMEKRYKKSRKDIYTAIEEMNPYTNVNTLVEQLAAVIS